jgi:hypothetical protein
MSKISDIITLANTLSDNLGTLAVDQKALNDDVVSLASEDPCAAGFGDKVNSLNERAGVLNSQFSTYKSQLSSLVAKYNDLGILDFGNKQEASDAIDAATKAITAINSIAQSFGGQAKRAALSASLAACPVDSASGGKTADPPSENSDPAVAKTDANGAPSAEGENQSSDDNPDTTQQTPPTNDTTTTVQEVVVTAGRPKKQKPGIRTKNPLSNFSSYTYQISLYMITPDAYQAFVLSDRTKLDAINNTNSADAAKSLGGNGAYVVAQSGGINNSTSKRAPGMNLDYYIDDLKMNTIISSKDTKTETNTTEFSFNVYEPYGFSFISDLKRAVDQLSQVNKSTQFSQNYDPMRQFFILGIKFRGYDKDGKVLSGNEHFASDTANPVGNNDGVFERFFDICIKTLKFKLDGKTTVYNITAASLPVVEAVSLKRGTLDKDTTVTAETIQDALDETNPNSLIAKLNNIELQMLNKDKPDISKVNTYKVKFLGNCDDLKTATLKTKNNLDKVKWADNPTKNVKDVNAKLEVISAPNSSASTVKLVQGTPVLQAISDMIKNSSYMSSAMQVLNEANSQGNPEVLNSKPKTLRWFNISPDVVCNGWDPKRNDYTYDITYVIQAYETPAAVALMANKLTPYYGPHKRYDYLFTGQNTEVISYEQQMNNTYFVNVYENPDLPGGDAGPPGIPKATGKPTGISTQGNFDTGAQSFGPYLTSLFDISAYATAKMQILGDPDYLMQTTTSGTQLDDVYNQFYGVDGFTINPNGGQVFIEVDFKEAKDYDHDNGYMKINGSILFWKYPPEAQVQGVSYQVRQVVSTFSKGKFIQTLDLFMNTFDDFKSTDATDSGRENQSDAETARLLRQASAFGNQGTGATNPTMQSQAAQNTAAGSLMPDTAPATNTQTSPTGGTSDQPPTAASIIANSPVVQASQSVPVIRDVADDDATSGNNRTASLDQGGREEG